MSKDPTAPIARAAAQTAAFHLRELPNTALEALIDLAVQAGAEALVATIHDEATQRHSRNPHP